MIALNNSFKIKYFLLFNSVILTILNQVAELNSGKLANLKKIVYIVKFGKTENKRYLR